MKSRTRCRIAAVSPFLRKLVPLLALCGLFACDKDLVPLVPRPIADGGPADAGGDAPWLFPSWGIFAASLAAPPCVGDLTLVVDTTTVELDGGATLDDPAQAGATLSLLEALTIAANRSERVAIFFDPQVFPANTPAIIAFDGGCDLPDLENTCVDGRDRGVIIDFGGDYSGGSRPTCTLNLRQDALVVGLELRKLTWQVSAYQGSQIAGCRFNSDGFEATPAGEPETLTPTGGALIGPGNSFGNTEGVRLKLTGMATIRGNYFGVDPVTGAQIFNQFGVHVWSLSALSGALRIEGNVFQSSVGIDFRSALAEGSTVHVVNNRFGRGKESAIFGWTGISGTISGGSTAVFGPDNVFEGLDRAIDINGQGAGVTITANSISDCGEAITIADPRVAPPTVTRATPTLAEGTCPVDGLVEIFVDEAAQAGTYIGNASCTAGSWTFSGALPGPNVTATLTTAEGTSMLSDAVAVQ